MLGRLLRRIWYLLNRRRLERELEREMAAHRAEMGEPHRFGGTLRLREQSADVWGWAWLDDLSHDLRYGLRQLRRAPGFALVAILTLAVGIGANTTAFAILNTVLLAELPVPEPRMLRQFEWAGRRTFSEAAFRYVRDHASGFSALTCVTDQTTATIGRADSYEQAQVVWVSGGFFQTFGSTTAIGRPLTPADDRPGAPPVAVISYEAWQRQFGAAASVVGSAVTVGDWPVTIVGVAQRGFSTSLSRRPPDLTLPMSVSTRSWAADGSQRERSCRIVGRLSQGRPKSSRGRRARCSCDVRGYHFRSTASLADCARGCDSVCGRSPGESTRCGPATCWRTMFPRLPAHSSCFSRCSSFHARTLPPCCSRERLRAARKSSRASRSAHRGRG